MAISAALTGCVFNATRPTDQNSVALLRVNITLGVAADYSSGINFGQLLADPNIIGTGLEGFHGVCLQRVRNSAASVTRLFLPVFSAGDGVLHLYKIDTGAFVEITDDDLDDGDVIEAMLWANIGSAPGWVEAGAMP